MQETQVTQKQFKDVMDYLVAHAFVGVAAKWGMVLSTILIIIDMFFPLSFNVLSGFILVPLASLWAAYVDFRRSRKNKV